MLAEGRFNKDHPDRYLGLVDRTWNDDPFLVAADFDDYVAYQARVDEDFANTDAWTRTSLRNIARAGYFSSDRTIRGYMADIWNTESLL